MTYCYKCGAKSSEEDSFCERCGEKIGEVLHHIEEEAEEIIKKTSYKGFVIFIVVLILIGYIILDIWAASQITPEISTNSLLTTITNLNGKVGLSSSSGSTKFVFENPTFVPIILFPISYEANYGSTKIASGKTEFVFIPPHSSNSIYADIEISHSGLINTALSGLANIFTGNKEEFSISFYELGFKFAEMKG